MLISCVYLSSLTLQGVDLTYASNMHATL